MKTNVIITAIIALAVIECWALYLGYDGTLMTLVIGAICALIGVVIPTPKILKD